MAFSKRKMSRFIIDHYHQDLYFIINGFTFETHGCWIWLLVYILQYYTL